MNKYCSIKVAIVVGYSPINGYELYHPKGKVSGDTAFKSDAVTFNCETSAKMFARQIGLSPDKIIIKAIQ